MASHWGQRLVVERCNIFASLKQMIQNDITDTTDQFHSTPENHWPILLRHCERTTEILKCLEDQNGFFEDGWFVALFQIARNAPRFYGLSNREVRRSNLSILPETKVETILFEGREAVGAMVNRNGQRLRLKARHVIVSAGALHTPALLMRSGIGQGTQLKDMGVKVIANSAGVGANLNEHPTIAVSAYLKSKARLRDNTGTRRHAQISLRYSSGLDDCGSGDMYASVTANGLARSRGAAGSFLMWCNKPIHGRVLLTSADPLQSPTLILIF